jgi:hypothetical protein
MSAIAVMPNPIPIFSPDDSPDEVLEGVEPDGVPVSDETVDEERLETALALGVAEVLEGEDDGTSDADAALVMLK